jgi:hypothetical protein
MGIVFGVTGVKEPSFTVLKNTANYSIRRYEDFFTATVKNTTVQNDNNNSFGILAKYIG